MALYENRLGLHGKNYLLEGNFLVMVLIVSISSFTSTKERNWHRLELG